jgi:hypothetical protein
MQSGFETDMTLMTRNHNTNIWSKFIKLLQKVTRIYGLFANTIMTYIPPKPRNLLYEQPEFLEEHTVSWN